MTEEQVAELLTLLGRIATALEEQPPVQAVTLPGVEPFVQTERPQDLTNMTAYVEVPLHRKRIRPQGRMGR